MEETINAIVEQRARIENQEMIKFLAKHKLPCDKQKLEKLGFKVMVTFHTNEVMQTGIEFVEFELVKIVDRQVLELNYKIKIIK